ncbi:hypothetical protein G5B37_06830 [Rasiella rasia]|uniref:Uncharacterized protein n=1 Tax=Rasiella rasia TaxID=2744027 RepID=A0A6G6GL18_9FLAO|nr:hypothetical protein [Rasiella rasia]QIE59286.1 hypothetical protein G5B37_06830 [Rasiella rasia]
MAILLTALSVNATAITTTTTEAHNGTQKQLDAHFFGNNAGYFIDQTQQEINFETEEDNIPLSVDDSLFFGTQSNCNTALLSAATHHKKIANENASISKYYTKQILFPFHSFW